MAKLIQRVVREFDSMPFRFVVSAQQRKWALASRLRSERGQTSSEYLLIAGMAVVIILAILGLFSGQLQSAASTIMGKITGAI